MDKTYIQIIIGIVTVCVVAITQLYISRRTIQNNKSTDLKNKAIEIIELLHKNNAEIISQYGSMLFVSWSNPDIFDKDISTILEKMRPRHDPQYLSRAYGLIYVHFYDCIENIKEISEVQNKIHEHIYKEIFNHICILKDKEYKISEDEVDNLFEELKSRTKSLSEKLRAGV